MKKMPHPTPLSSLASSWVLSSWMSLPFLQLWSAGSWHGDPEFQNCSLFSAPGEGGPPCGLCTPLLSLVFSICKAALPFITVDFRKGYRKGLLLIAPFCRWGEWGTEKEGLIIWLYISPGGLALNLAFPNELYSGCSGLLPWYGLLPYYQYLYPGEACQKTVSTLVKGSN